MQFKTYDEVDPQSVARLTLAGFGWNLDAKSVKRLKRQDKNCADWFAMYAVEGDEAVSQVGAAYPTIETTEGPMELGYIWGVTTLPTMTRKGISRELMERVHARMREDGIELFALSTSKSLVAHSLYESLGYRHIQDYGWNMKISERKKYNGIRVSVRKRSTQQIFDLYKRSSKGALGFVHRHEKFVEPRCTWFPYITNVCTFYRDERAIGYALATIGPKSVVIREACSPDLSELPHMVSALERKHPGKPLYCMVHSRDDVIASLGEAGLAPTRPSFGVLMMRLPEGKASEKSLKKLVGKDTGKFQFTSTDEY